MTVAIEASGLVKRFGSTTALAGLDLEVPAGTVFGLLGPNGAGKTTTIRILATLARPDAGTARVLGHDVVRDPGSVRRRVALTGQFAALDEDLTGLENLVLVGRLLGHPGAAARTRAGELLAAFDLADAARRQVRTYSGGMRRRLDIAASLVVRPEVLFLDEPTTGLDPHSRAQVWDIVRAIARAGTTVVLTTQYLEEADQLADRVAVVDHGVVVAEGSTAQLKASVGAGSFRVQLAEPDHRDEARSVLAGCLDSPVRGDADAATLVASLPSGRTTEVAARALAALADRGIEVLGLTLGRPSLDEVFLTLTGHAPEEVSPA